MNHPESDLQVELVEYLEYFEKKDCFTFFAVPNEALGKARSGAGIARMKRLQKMGLRSGVADLIFFKRGRAYCLELKSKVGKQSESQKNFESICLFVGVPYVVARSFNEAVSVLKEWGILCFSA